jgi:hypothetical protein
VTANPTPSEPSLVSTRSRVSWSQPTRDRVASFKPPPQRDCTDRSATYWPIPVRMSKFRAEYRNFATSRPPLLPLGIALSILKLGTSALILLPRLTRPG